jgi:hypothetical protein
MTDEAPHAPALLRCARCGRVLPANRVELLGYARAGLPACCGAEMDLYIQAERPAPDEGRIVALPLPLPDPDQGTAVIPVPQARKGPR